MPKKNTKKKFLSVEEIMTFAIQEEKDAYKFYISASEQMADPEMAAFLLELAELEKEHHQILINKLEEYRANNFSSKGIIASFDDKIEN